MYLRTTQRRNKDGSVVRYYALAENVRDPEKGHVEAKVVHSFGRADRLERAPLERLVRSIRRVLDADAGEAPAAENGRGRTIAIEASFDLGIVHVVEQLWIRLGIGKAIADTRDGMPVRSWVLPGDTADVTTVQRIKDDLRQMRLGRALFVGDAGLYAKANLAELSRGAGRYILATPIGRVKEIKEEVLSRPGRYAKIAPNLRAKEVIVGQGERRRRYILCLNAEEAEREKRHRDELLDLLQLELDRLASDHPKAACRLVASKRFGPYLSLDAEGRPYIDRAKVARAERLDGKFVLTTNDDTLSAADIALGYKGMWLIEACFRKMKTTGLGVRPMFHWTPRRIVAHVKLCVLALMIQRTAEIATGTPWSQLADVLERLKAVRYTAEGETIVQASRIAPELAAILEKLAIATPKPILAVG
jgi:hypothetical protein